MPTSTRIGPPITKGSTPPGLSLVYGVTVRWYLPILLLAFGMIFKFAWFAIEAQLDQKWIPYAISILGFVGWPVCAALLIMNLPQR